MCYAAGGPDHGRANRTNGARSIARNDHQRRRRDVGRDILRQQEALRHQRVGGGRHCIDVVRVGSARIPVALLQRGPRVAGREAMRLRVRKRDVLAAAVAAVDHARSAARVGIGVAPGALGPSSVGRDRYGDARYANPGDVVAVAVRLRHEDLIGRAEQDGRRDRDDALIEFGPEIEQIAGMVNAVVKDIRGRRQRRVRG